MFILFLWLDIKLSCIWNHQPVGVIIRSPIILNQPFMGWVIRCSNTSKSCGTRRLSKTSKSQPLWNGTWNRSQETFTLNDIIKVTILCNFIIHNGRRDQLETARNLRNLETRKAYGNQCHKSSHQAFGGYSMDHLITGVPNFIKQNWGLWWFMALGLPQSSMS